MPPAVNGRRKSKRKGQLMSESTRAIVADHATYPEFQRFIRFNNEVETARWLERHDLPIGDGLPARLTFYRWLYITRQLNDGYSA